jgi:2-polyprenyl-6-methoxyphenol hydroxylase-like FAD-dependent oxidoreductase
MSPELILKEVTDNLAKEFPSDFLTVAKQTNLSNLAWSPLRFRVPWNVAFGKAQNGNLTVAGDAMHPMTPDIGQGGCSALEDAVVLARCLSQAHTMAADDRQWAENGLKRYVAERRWRVALLVAGAWLSGYVQQGGRVDQDQLVSRLARWFRDRVMFKYALPMIMDWVWKGCGDLPTPVKYEAGST